MRKGGNLETNRLLRFRSLMYRERVIKGDAESSGDGRFSFYRSTTVWKAIMDD